MSDQQQKGKKGYLQPDANHTSYVYPPFSENNDHLADPLGIRPSISTILRDRARSRALFRLKAAANMANTRLNKLMTPRELFVGISKMAPSWSSVMLTMVLERRRLIRGERQEMSESETQSRGRDEQKYRRPTQGEGWTRRLGEWTTPGTSLWLLYPLVEAEKKCWEYWGRLTALRSLAVRLAVTVCHAWER